MTYNVYCIYYIIYIQIYIVCRCGTTDTQTTAQYVPNYRVCDGYYHCRDFSDEDPEVCQRYNVSVKTPRKYIRLYNVSVKTPREYIRLYNVSVKTPWKYIRLYNVSVKTPRKYIRFIMSL